MTTRLPLTVLPTELERLIKLSRWMDWENLSHRWAAVSTYDAIEISREHTRPGITHALAAKALDAGWLYVGLSFDGKAYRFENLKEPSSDR